MATVSCQAFEKQEDGSWVTLMVTDIRTPDGDIRLRSGMRFTPEGALLGIPVVELLEESCGK